MIGISTLTWVPGARTCRDMSVSTWCQLSLCEVISGAENCTGNLAGDCGDFRATLVANGILTPLARLAMAPVAPGAALTGTDLAAAATGAWALSNVVKGAGPEVCAMKPFDLSSAPTTCVPSARQLEGNKLILAAAAHAKASSRAGSLQCGACCPRDEPSYVLLTMLLNGLKTADFAT